MIKTHGLSMASAHYARLGRQECANIHMASLEILERVGIDVHDQKARALLVKRGAKADGIRIRIPEHMVTKALAVMPKRMTLYDRHGKVAIHAWGYNTCYGGGSDCLNILDHRTGQRRKPLLKDVEEAITLMDALPEIDFVMSAFLPEDVDQRIYERYQMEMMLNNTTKLIVFVTPDFEGAAAAVEMCEVVAEGTAPVVHSAQRRRRQLAGYHGRLHGLDECRDAARHRAGPAGARRFAGWPWTQLTRWGQAVTI